MNFEQVVEASADVVAFGNFGDFADDSCEVGCYFAVYASHFDVAEHDETLVEFFGVEYGDVFLDVSVAFETFQTFEHGG